MSFKVLKVAGKIANVLALALVVTILSFTTKLNNEPVTEFYYMQLQPVKAGLPYYFSQSLSITYNDNTDLLKQKRQFMHELKAEVILDKLDTANYRSYVPPPADNKDHCDAQRMAAIKTLQEDGKDVISREIHQ
jgi:hypothetical protein